MNVTNVDDTYNLTVEYFANGTKIVRDMHFRRLFAADSPSVGDKVTLCYSPNDNDDIAVENGKLTCAPPDPITLVAVYIAHALKFLAAFSTVSIEILSRILYSVSRIPRVLFPDSTHCYSSTSHINLYCCPRFYR